MSGVGRIVGQGVLVADVVGDLRADGLRVVHVFREKRQAAGGIGQFAERGARLFHGAMIVLDVVVAEQAHGINQGIVPLGLLDCIFQAVRLALSSPSVTTRITFLSRVPFFR